MDISRLQNILNALGLTKKVETPSKVGKSNKKEAQSSQQGEEIRDSVVISDEAFLKINVENTSNQVKEETQTIREDKIEEVKNKIANQQLSNPSQVAQKIIYGPDIYEELR